MTMTSEAKGALAETIRRLRGRLLEDLHAAVESSYRMAVRAREAGLDEAALARRERLERWQAEQVRAQGAPGSEDQKGAGTKRRRSAEEFRLEAEKQAAYTLLNRLVLLRLLEGHGLRQPAVVKGGWDSRAYQDFRALAPGLCQGDETEGYAFLLRLVFEDLARELPGLYEPAGVAELVPLPPATLRAVVEALDQPVLASCWTDDMTLGWVYQYWNDPEREALDASAKIEPHEIASKTQMFTERYMVDWLLQNSLGPLWLALCKQQGWTPQVEADGTLARLEARRVEWRRRREAGAVALTELMPLETAAERRWAYYVPQPPLAPAGEAPTSVRDWRVLDPAVGSGHFLMVAFDLLVALYHEEAAHRGEVGQPQWAPRVIVERILEHNLHGIDLDPRAVQIAAAALWLKAQQAAPGAQPRTLHLVASNLRLAGLRDDDPALKELRQQVEVESGIPGALVDQVVHALRGADHLGSLLQVDKAVEEAIEKHEQAVATRRGVQQLSLLGGPAPAQVEVDFQASAARRSLVERLEEFLAQHTGGDDLGLRLRGEQLAAGVRFIRMAQPERYDLVVGNPPYLGMAKMAETAYVQIHYEQGKENLYSAFLERGLQLVREGGLSALLTMRGWMFLGQFAKLRQDLLAKHDLRLIGDVDRGAFEEVADEVIAAAMCVVRRSPMMSTSSIAIQPTPPSDKARDSERTKRKRAAVLVQVGRFVFSPAILKAVDGSPILYWWTTEFIINYVNAKKLKEEAPVRQGMATGNDARFLRKTWENRTSNYKLRNEQLRSWQPFVKGASGLAWFEPLDTVVDWKNLGLGKRCAYEFFGTKGGGNGTPSRDFYFRPGIAFSMIGNSFAARAHRYPSIFGHKGSSVFTNEISLCLCLMNSAKARFVLESLNPGIGFEVGDVNRLPIFPIESADDIYATLDRAFTEHEAARETSVEFKGPGPSPWRYAQEWAQTAVDRAAGVPLPPYSPVYDQEPATAHLSYAFGVALGRFSPDGRGILDPSRDDLAHALPAGVCFLDGTLDDNDRRDSLGHPAAARLHDAWSAYGPAIDPKSDLRSYLRLKLFSDVHRGAYDNRPIHWPLSSASKTFVAWVTIHRLNDQTLRVLLADHLHPALLRIEGELTDLRAARSGADKKAARAAERRYDKVLKGQGELQAFIAQVSACADLGPPPCDSKCPPRERDARYAPDLDDGVMINSAALWPLLDPQWKDPKKWWRELASAQGKKDYDWSHLAQRYFPSRVADKCLKDPSLAVAHGCFWRHHPARAWAWELRLQSEIAPDFRIDEPDAAGSRAAFLHDHPAEALAALEKEALRRMGRGESRKPLRELRTLEPGLWSAHPGDVWDLELRVAQKQGEEFHLRAPDEPQARAAYLARHPQRQAERSALLATLPSLFASPAEDEDPAAAAAADDGAEDEDQSADED